MCPPAKGNGVWPFNDAWLRTSLEEARRQAPRNGASILDSARELRIRDAQEDVAGGAAPTLNYLSSLPALFILASQQPQYHCPTPGPRRPLPP